MRTLGETSRPVDDVVNAGLRMLPVRWIVTPGRRVSAKRRTFYLPLYPGDLGNTTFRSRTDRTNSFKMSRENIFKAIHPRDGDDVSPSVGG